MGWYDTRGCGACNDYCRWVGNSLSGGDPSLTTVYQTTNYKGVLQTSFWACQVPDNIYHDYKKEGKFLYKKCSARGEILPEEDEYEEGEYRIEI